MPEASSASEALLGWSGRYRRGGRMVVALAALLLPLVSLAAAAA
jgi:hypothetical protein